MPNFIIINDQSQLCPMELAVGRFAFAPEAAGTGQCIWHCAGGVHRFLGWQGCFFIPRQACSHEGAILTRRQTCKPQIALPGGRKVILRQNLLPSQRQRQPTSSTAEIGSSASSEECAFSIGEHFHSAQKSSRLIQLLAVL